MAAGVEKAWTILDTMPHDEVCRNAQARFDSSSNTYFLPTFGHDVSVCPARRDVSASSPALAAMLGKLRHFSELSILWYLVSAKDVSPSGKLIRPSDMSLGQIYTAGSHVLPLDKLAQKYGGSIGDFMTRGEELGAVSAGLGDASLRLFPFPRIPITVILWKECDEFPARADLLLDSSCETHLPLDIAWSTALLSLLMLM